MKIFRSLIIVLTLTGTSLFVHAHHSVAGAFCGARGCNVPTSYFEGKIVKIGWGNPHIFMNIEITGGDVEAGQNWQLFSHPVHIMQNTYGFSKDDFKVGDSLKVIGWKHLRGYPALQTRAIQINDGPMRSTLRFADMREIVSGKYKTNNVLVAPTLDGSNPVRSGPETVKGLRKLGLLDDKGMLKLPSSFPDSL